MFDNAIHEHFRNVWVEKWISFAKQLPFTETHIYRTSMHIQNENGEYFQYMRENGISGNPNMSMELIEKHRGIYLCPSLSLNPNMTFDYAITKGDGHIDWRILEMHPNITLDIIKNNKSFQWNYKRVAGNPNITEQMLYDNPDMFPPDKIWKNSRIGYNPNITISSLVEHGCNVYQIGNNPNLTIDDILQKPDMQWQMDEICCNPKIGKKIFAGEIEQMEILNSINLRRSSFFTKLTNDLNFANANDIRCYCFSLYATMEQIEQSILQPLCWDAISRNENLTMNFTTKYWDKPWDYDELFKNEMKHDRETYINNKIAHLLIATIYENHPNAKCETLFEWVVADEYIMSFICKF